MEPLLSPQGKPFGMKWFHFFYTVRFVFSFFLILVNIILLYSQWKEGTPLPPFSVLSLIFSLPALVIYPYTCYLYKKIWKGNLASETATLRDWTYGELGVELVGNIFSFNPAMILGGAISFFLQRYYFKKRFMVFNNL